MRLSIFLGGGKHSPPSPASSIIILLVFSISGLCLLLFSSLSSSIETRQKLLIFPFNYSATESLYATWQAGGKPIRFGAFDFLVIAEFDSSNLPLNEAETLFHFDISGLSSICTRSERSSFYSGINTSEPTRKK